MFDGEGLYDGYGLIDAGIPASRFCIEAIDISQQAIDQARAGSMAAIPFAAGSGVSRPLFSSRGAGWALRDDVRATVRFSQGNIFSPTFWRRRWGLMSSSVATC
jgi:chemotaxis protein methyltransferase WspC